MQSDAGCPESKGGERNVERDYDMAVFAAGNAESG